MKPIATCISTWYLYVTLIYSMRDTCRTRKTDYYFEWNPHYTLRGKHAQLFVEALIEHAPPRILTTQIQSLNSPPQSYYFIMKYMILEKNQNTLVQSNSSIMIFEELYGYLHKYTMHLYVVLQCSINLEKETEEPE